MAYVKPDPAIFMQKYEESTTRRGASQYEGWSPKKGLLNRPPQRNVIRIMPPHPNMIVTMPDGTEGPDAIIGSLVHFNLGPQQNLGSPCLEWFGKMCPGCAWNKDCQRKAEEARGAGNAIMAAQYKELAYRQRATNRFRCQVVDISKPEMGVQRYSFGVGVEKGLRTCFTDDSIPPKYLDITDPETGRNVIMDVSMKIGKDKKEMPDYSDIKRAMEITPLMDMEWLDQIQDLTEDFWWEPTTDQVAGALQGVKMDRPNTMTSLPGATAAPTPALPSPAIVSSGPVPAAARSITPPAPAPAAAPTPVATPAAAAIGRRGGRGAPPAVVTPPAAAVAAPTPAPPAAVPAQVPPVAVAQPMPGRRGRAAAAPAGEVAPGPYAAARQLVVQFVAQGYEGRPVPAFDILEITPEQAAQAFATKMAPPCYEPPDTDPSDGGCRDCRMLLACLTKKYGLAA